jgi:hypothetical protein
LQKKLKSYTYLDGYNSPFATFVFRYRSMSEYQPQTGQFTWDADRFLQDDLKTEYIVPRSPSPQQCSEYKPEAALDTANFPSAEWRPEDEGIYENDLDIDGGTGNVMPAVSILLFETPSQAHNCYF